MHQLSWISHSESKQITAGGLIKWALPDASTGHGPGTLAPPAGESGTSFFEAGNFQCILEIKCVQ